MRPQGWGELSKMSQKGWNGKEGRGHKDFKVSQNSQESTCARVFFLNKVADLRPGTLLKKTL